MSQEKKQQRREYGVEFKLAAVRRALAGERIAAVAAELGIRRKFIYAWKDRYLQFGEGGLAMKSGRPRAGAQEAALVEPQAGRGELLAARRRIAELERKVGQQELELDFFAEALRRVETIDGVKKSTKPSAR